MNQIWSDLFVNGSRMSMQEFGRAWFQDLSLSIFQHHWPERLPCWNMDHAMANKDVFFLSTWQIVIYFNNNPLVYSVLGGWCQGGKLGSSRLTLRYWWFSFVSRFWIQHLRGKKITEYIFAYTNAHVYIYTYIYIHFVYVRIGLVAQLGHVGEILGTCECTTVQV